MLRATIPILLAAATPFGAPPPAGESTVDESVTATIDAGATSAPISPYVYGQFIEHIGDLVNRRIWAEMIDDRKFYHPIVANPVEQKPVRGRRSNRWLLIGPEASIVMDRKQPYAGDQSHRGAPQCGQGTQ